MTVKRMIEKLEAKWPEGSWMDGNEKGWGNCVLSGESCELDVEIDGEKFKMPAFDYYADDFMEQTYVMGVLKEVHEFVDTFGLYWEAQDPGTYLLFIQE